MTMFFFFFWVKVVHKNNTIPTGMYYVQLCKQDF